MYQEDDSQISESQATAKEVLIDEEQVLAAVSDSSRFFYIFDSI